MRVVHVILILTVSLSPLFIISQEKKNNEKTKVKNSEEEEYDLKKYSAMPNDRVIFEVNHTGLLNLPSNIKMRWKSLGINVALMFDKPLGRSNFSLGYGIGIYSHNFHSNAEFIYRRDSISKNTVTDWVPKLNNYTLNRFTQRILEIPLELRFRTKTIQKFKVMMGGKFGYVVSDFRKVFDDKGKIKMYDTKNLNYLRYGVVFRVGIDQVCLTASYYFSEVFLKDKGVNGLLPYSFGIAIIPN